MFLVAISAVSADESAGNSTVQSDVVDSSSGNKDVVLLPTKLSTTYSSGKNFKVKVSDAKSKKPISGVKLSLKVYTGKKYKTATVTSDRNGIANYKASKLGVGKHKVIVGVKDKKKFNSKSKNSLIVIKKAPIKISAPKATNYYKQNSKFKVTIKNKQTNNPIKGVKVTLKVFTGKKFKKYSLKTDGNGEVSINTKKLSKSLHKVIIEVKGTSKVKSASSKSSINIKENKVTSIKIKVNGHVLTVKLVDNSATRELVKKLRKGDITVNAQEYGGFEKVGGLGFSLPTSDKTITTSAGDVVLYDGDEISLFYNSNSWSYTRLGKVQNVDSQSLKEILGSGDVTLVLTL